MFFNLYKNNRKNLILDIIILLTLTILFIKFFIIIEVYPLHDEIVIIERNTKWHNFLWRNYTSNHTINSLFAVIIKSIFGFNILYYRFVSFIFFSLILILFRKLYPNLLLYCIFISIILSSQLLTNYIWIFRGYYSWAFFTVLSFFYLKKFIINNFDNKNYKILLIINLILLCHAIFTLYIVFPIFICLFFIFINNFIKKNNDFKIKEKILNFFIFFLIPLISFYFLVIIIEGFIINYWDNLTINFFLQNILKIIQDGFVPGFKSIFLDSHLNQYVPKGNFFFNLYTSLINNELFTRNSQIENQYTIFAVYLVSVFVLIYKALTKKFDYLDLTQAIIFLFFYLIHFVPEPRVHVGIVFFNIFYIFNNINLIYVKKIETNFLITLSILFLTIFNISNTKSDERYYETKLSIDKINLLKKKNNCNELNYLLSEYEIWIMKNIYNKECRFYYDFKNEKNILY